MFNDNSSPALTGVTISRNYAADNGGGMANHTASSPVLSGGTISGNYSGGDGGGMYGEASSSPILTNVAIAGNTAGGPNSNGGGMYNAPASSPVLINVTISGNTVPIGTASNGRGGGMYNTNSSPVLINVTISGNTANEGGGGMFNEAGPLVLINVLISGNTVNISNALYGGGGMENYNYSVPKLINVTITGNYAAGSGGGMFNGVASTPVVQNSIIWRNTAPTDPGIKNNSSTPEFAHSIVQGSGGGSWNSSAGNEISGYSGTNKDENPRFISPDPAGTNQPKPGGNYRLDSGSPAIDAGNDILYPDNTAHAIFSGITLSTEAQTAINAALALGTDLDGNPRRNGTIDMGAYER
jgi:hypothetical protein